MSNWNVLFTSIRGKEETQRKIPFSPRKFARLVAMESSSPKNKLEPTLLNLQSAAGRSVGQYKEKSLKSKRLLKFVLHN